MFIPDPDISIPDRDPGAKKHRILDLKRNFLTVFLTNNIVNRL
jgi:hypothetical protein